MTADETRPLSADERALWHALKSLGGLAASLLGGELMPGLSGADFGVLSRLEELGGDAMTLGQTALAKSLGWDKSRLSHQLTRMEDRGLVKRTRAAASKAVAVVLLAPGAETLARARPQHAAAVRRRFLDQLSPSDAAALIRLAKKLG